MNNFDPYDKTQDEPENPIPPFDAGVAEHPQRIGRYRIEKVLGKGGFGIVYLAHDEQLNRRVAVKVPHAKLISKPEDAEAYLAEARTVANLDHPGIVPVHDVGSMDNYPCYIVSKYIPGTDFATKIKQHRLKYREAAEIVATVAEALHYAHKQGLVHRDVKPGNILIGKDDKPYVVDFGLALREENIGKGPKYAGTPAYMSPEQARGEGHRVDGRSDVFSLGVVFYELLAGRQPFRGDTQAELLEQVTSYEARPLRQYDEKLPKELERICHKAMAKRANDRYSSAHDLAEDLRHFLADQTLIQSGASPGGIVSVASETHASHIASTSVGSIAASSASLGIGSSDSQPIKIVPKGLRSFDAHDADFFLELLPGPRDREGLPDSLRFWKTRIEEIDPDNTFKVGLIYGPSGCGKSSLVKAGLLPRLSEEVISVYIEATTEETETRLLHGLRKRCPALEDNLTMTGNDSATQTQAGQKYFQLTHDYLVPSLRDWLTRKQRETKQGRAELKLDERASAWNAKRETKQLPTLTEWIGIRRLTDRRHWTDTQRKMMVKAGRVHGIRSALACAGLIVLVSIGSVVRTQITKQQTVTRIEGLVGRLVSAEPTQLPQIVKDLDSNPEVATTFLYPLVSGDAKTIDEKRSQLHARLAMVSRDKSLVEPLLEELLTNKVVYIGPIRQQLRPYAGELTERLRAILRDEKAEANRRFRAAAALADLVPESEAASWTEQDLQFVAGQLVVENSEFQPLLRENLRPISSRLLPDLEKIFGDTKSTDAQRLSTANAFADYAASDIATLSKLLTVATPEQYKVLYPLFAASPAPSTVEDLSKIASTLPPTELSSVERIAYGQRRANSAVTLLRLGEREKVLPVFDMTDDPEALTQFIFRCRDRGVRVEELLDLLSITTRSVSEGPRRNARELYAVLLALGEYPLSDIPESRREALLKQLADSYRKDPSSGVHGAAGWLLRHWGQNEAVREVDQTAVPYSTEREWFTLAINVTPTSPLKPKEKPAEDKGEKESKTEQPAEGEETKKAEREDPKPEPLPQKTFYYTFVVFPAGESEIGSVSDEPDRSKNEKGEVRHSVTLTRPFALLDREITMEELIAFKPSYEVYMQQFASKPTDGGFAADWYDSVSFCRWLGQHSGMSESDQSYADPESLGKEDYPREPNPSANWAPRNWPLQLSQSGFRLPTESEWEVASRAGGRTAYGYGSEVGLLGRFGWFQENSGKRVHPPRELRPSVRGSFDMHGNVFEWTHDWSSAYEEGNVVDPMVSKKGTSRVDRGGGWIDVAANCRSAYRDSGDPTYRSINRGFRMALSPSVKQPEAGQGAKPLGVGTEGASAEQRPELP